MKKYLLPGLVILLPIALTLFVVDFILHFLTKPFMGIVSKAMTSYGIAQNGFLFLSADQTLRLTSQIFIIVVLVLVTFLLGMVGRWFLFRSLIGFGEKIMHKIPFVNKIYKAFQEITKSFLDSDKQSFSEVVLVPFPRKGLWTVALVSGKAPSVLDLSEQKDHLSLFVPTAPSPTNGFLILAPKADLLYLDCKVDEALKYVISCGMILPEAKDRE